MATKKTLDRSDAADAKRFRWLLDGNGYFVFKFDDYTIPVPHEGEEPDETRNLIDKFMEDASLS